jgi:predicted nuclease of predicted toxin-antitoxin system
VSVRLLANEDFPRPALAALRAAGVDVEAVGELMPMAGNTKALGYAVQSGRWVVTFDRDYGEYVFARRVASPPAIVYLRQGSYAPSWPAEAVLAAIACQDVVLGHLVVIDGRSVRRRALPAQPGRWTASRSRCRPCRTGPTARASVGRSTSNRPSTTTCTPCVGRPCMHRWINLASRFGASANRSSMSRRAPVTGHAWIETISLSR